MYIPPPKKGGALLEKKRKGQPPKYIKSPPPPVPQSGTLPRTSRSSRTVSPSQAWLCHVLPVSTDPGLTPQPSLLHPEGTHWKKSRALRHGAASHPSMLNNLGSCPPACFCPGPGSKESSLSPSSETLGSRNTGRVKATKPKTNQQAPCKKTQGKSFMPFQTSLSDFSGNPVLTCPCFRSSFLGLVSNFCYHFCCTHTSTPEYV